MSYLILCGFTIIFSCFLRVYNLKTNNYELYALADMTEDGSHATNSDTPGTPLQKTHFLTGLYLQITPIPPEPEPPT